MIFGLVLLSCIGSGCPLRLFLLLRDIHFVHLGLRPLFSAGGSMAKVYIGVVPMLDRTVELLNSHCKLPPAPRAVKWRDEKGKMMGWVFGPVEREEFYIDESELPY